MSPLEITKTTSSNLLFDEEFLDNENTKDLDEDAPISWRLDSSNSLSDWTIIIVRQSDETRTTTYHVHKTFLAIGPRRSDYFAKMFKIPQGLSETTTSTSKITLEDSAVDAFPFMLDYMYSLIDNVEGGMTGNSAVQATALRYLSRYFCIPRLYEQVTSFIQKDLRPETAMTYFVEADIHVDEKIAMAACAMCAQNMEIVDSTRLTELSPRLFQTIVTADGLKCDSAALSVIVAAFLEKQSDNVTVELLTALTDSKFMPIVSSEGAESLLHFYLAYQEDILDENAQQEDSLRQRCTTALAGSWKQVATNRKRKEDVVDDDQKDKNKTANATSSKVDWSILNTDILEACLSNAKDELEACLRNTKDELEVCKRNAKAQVDKKDLTIRSQTNELYRNQNMIPSLNHEIAKLTIKNNELTMKNNGYASQMSKFVRVPYNSELQVVWSCNKSVQSGQPMPRVVPSRGKSGYMYQDEKQGKGFPLLYYKG
eukprot:scaffold90216_cov53-Attheya_sp.AAC.2